MTAAAESGPTRRLLLTVCAVALMDTMLYAVLTPLLPRMVRELHVGEGTAGLLVAAFAVGSFTGALPAGLVSTHLGSKVAVILGMTLLSVASLVFAMAGNLEGLLAARFVQGLSSAMSWSGAIGWLLSAARGGIAATCSVWRSGPASSGRCSAPCSARSRRSPAASSSSSA